jgi:hypothetical protein
MSNNELFIPKFPAIIFDIDHFININCIHLNIKFSNDHYDKLIDLIINMEEIPYSLQIRYYSLLESLINHFETHSESYKFIPHYEFIDNTALFNKFKAVYNTCADFFIINEPP